MTDRALMRLAESSFCLSFLPEAAADAALCYMSGLQTGRRMCEVRLLSVRTWHCT